jgi:acyl-CoA synthetase (AMP-forming)/AMP-acid ligase II
MPKEPTSLVEICRDHAQVRGERDAYRFSDDQRMTAHLSFAELDRAARQVACHLQDRCQPGDRVLLLLESGYDFVRAFFGCLYAGMIAVPMNVPSAERRLAAAQAIARNAGARVMLASSSVLKMLDDPTIEGVEVSTLFEHGGDRQFCDPNVGADTPAFLQYTSGSTGTPKGVVVTHGNLLANLAMIRRGFSHGPDTVGVGWLPLTHDMGLVGLVLQPAYLGVPSILMRPLTFVRNPLRWLQLISEYRATTSGGPDFAYALCVRRLEDRHLEGLDLSSWRVAFNGAEPIRAQTLEAFARKFAKVGFSRKAFYPCYGLAEATLFVAGPEAGSAFRARRVLADALEDGLLPEQDVGDEQAERARTLVGCGQPWGGATVRIVRPETQVTLGQGMVGEIWISGPHVANGYWNNREATARTFDAYSAEGDGPFLRTGDLGFLESGQLYVTGRLKDVLIVRGKNHYPQDIEHTAAECDEALIGRPGAAFLISEPRGDVLALVQEVSKTFNMRRSPSSRSSPAILRTKILEAVAREHGLKIGRLVLVAPGSLPMTTSGKIQRARTQQLLLAGQLKEIAAEAAPAISEP